MLIGIATFGLHRPRQDRFQFGKRQPPEIGHHAVGIDQASQHVCLCEQGVQVPHCRHVHRVAPSKVPPPGYIAGGGNPRTGEIKPRQRAVTSGPPRRNRKVEGRQLRTPWVKFEAEHILPQRRVGCLRQGRAFLGGAHRRHNRQGKDEEVATAHARIQHRDFPRHRGPVGEGPGCRAPRISLAHEAQVRPVDPGQGASRAQRVLATGLARQCGIGGQHLSRPPRAQGVVQEEPHHVVLGEELGHRGHFGGADPPAGAVDAVPLVGLPVLVDPSEGIV